jgi:hypothetical protein
VICSMIVKMQRPIQFQNDCGCIVDLKELERAIFWYTNKPVFSKKRIFMHGKYPAVAIHNEKIHVHRLLMMYWKNRRLRKDEYVHHVDENKLNASKDNLDLIPEKLHQSMHNKGRIFLEIHKSRISEANRRRAGTIVFQKKRFIPLDKLGTMLKEKRSINSIAKHFGVDWSTIKARINEHPELLG